MFGMSKDSRPAKRKVKAPAGESANPFVQPEPEEAKVEVTVPLTPAQHAKLQKLGGVKWIHAQLEKAKPGSA